MIDTAYYSQLQNIESAGKGDAKNPRSSARGFYQWTDGTAKQYGLIKDGVDYRGDRQAEDAAIAKFTEDNFNQLKTGLGREPTKGELYLAHQQGAGGALTLLKNPEKNAIEAVGKDQVLNNGGKEEMSAAEFANVWTQKFGDKPIESKANGRTILLPDGNQIQLSGQETPEVLMQIKKKILEKYNIQVDRKTGANPAVRSFVGSVYEEKDKLSSLQQYYPDAMTYGEDNFIFTNPDTGKLTLYNPKGLDLGDVASVAREGAQLAGGTLGSVAGASVGTVVAPGPGTVAGGMTGAGLGFAAAGSAFDTMLGAFGLTVDTRTPGQKVGDFAIEAATATAGDGIGRAVFAVGKPLVKQAAGAVKTSVKNVTKKALGASPRAQALLQQFRSFGIEPSPSLITDSAGWGRVEAGMAQVPASAEIMEKQAQQVISDTHKAVESIVKKIGEPKTSQGAGEAIRSAAIAAGERFSLKQEKIYGEVFDLIGPNTRVGVSAVTELKKEMMREAASAPKSLAKTYSRAIGQLDNIIADAYEGGIEFGALRSVRTNIGRDLDTPLLTGSTGSQNAALKRVYGALTEDLSSAARGTSDEAAKKLAVADRATRIWYNTAGNLMNKISKFDADERAFKFAMSSAKDGGTSLSRLRRHFTPEEWDTVAASVLDKLGDASAGMQGAAGDTFSVNSFLTNWNKLSPEAKKALFGGQRYAEATKSLDQLTVLMSRIKEVSRYSNTSNTAGALQSGLLMWAVVGGGAGGLLRGDLEGAAYGAATAVLAPRMAAKLLTNPKFVSWLAEPLEQAVKKGANETVKFSTSGHMARLALIAKEEPEIQMEINAYLKSLRENLQE